MAAPGMLAMPSKAVDFLWHDFILHTEDYQDFCRHAYGRTLHHSPESSMSADDLEALNGEGISRTFAMACADGGIRLPKTLELLILFQGDTALAIPGHSVLRPHPSTACAIKYDRLSPSTSRFSEIP